MSQIWLASKSGAHHYALRDRAWIDTRDGTELFAVLSRVVSIESGQTVVLRPAR